MYLYQTAALIGWGPSFDRQAETVIMQDFADNVPLREQVFSRHAFHTDTGFA